MASQRSSRALRVALRQASAPRVQQRTFVSAVNAASRPSVQPAQKAIASSFVQQTRGAKTVDFAGDKEKVYERNDWPHDKLLDYFKNDTLALIGYGSQGHGQGLNLRDNGLNVIVGVRKDGASWKDAIQDGWVPGKNLFEVDEAIQKGSII
ncbi:Ketol-acid reductoisomerase, partial [Hortaea werneckii]